MFSIRAKQCLAALITDLILLTLITATGLNSPALAKANTHGSVNKDVAQPSKQIGKHNSCGECPNAGRQQEKTDTLSNNRKKAKASPCHPLGYLDPRVVKDFNGALRDMKRTGIQPKITSTWRSSNDQNKMYQCSISKRCRVLHPGLYHALPAGQSMHEAGFAIDISGIAVGPRGAKRLTPQGRQIVQIMSKHGFRWRYRLADPVHFEADPKEHGYKSYKQAISFNQTRCQARIASAGPAKPKDIRAETRTYSQPR